MNVTPFMKFDSLKTVTSQTIKDPFELSRHQQLQFLLLVDKTSQQKSINSSGKKKSTIFLKTFSVRKAFKR